MNHNILLAAIIIIAAVVSWLIWMLMRPEFFREMQFLNMEISRNVMEVLEKARKSAGMTF